MAVLGRVTEAALSPRWPVRPAAPPLSRAAVQAGGEWQVDSMSLLYLAAMDKGRSLTGSEAPDAQGWPWREGWIALGAPLRKQQEKLESSTLNS